MSLQMLAKVAFASAKQNAVVILYEYEQDTVSQLRRR